MARRAKGIRRHGLGWQAYIQVQGVMRWKRFALDTPLETMQRWRTDQREKAKPTDPPGTFAADVAEYLTRVRTMPTYAERKRHLDLWVDALGAQRPRDSITTAEIDAQLHAWKATGKTTRAPTPQPLSDTAVRHRRTALLHFFNVMNAPGQENPVTRAWRPKDPKAAARAISPATIAAILAEMGPTQTRARLSVMAATGLPHKQLAAITPEDIDWAGKRLRVRGRKKGDGTADRWLPLSPMALRALTAFRRLECFGPFSASSMRKSWRLACEKCGVAVGRPYDLKHSLGTLLYAQTKDLAAVARLLDVSLQTAQRYTLGAHAAVDAAAMTAAGRTLRLPRR